jgi:hypothetical protein
LSNRISWKKVRDTGAPVKSVRLVFYEEFNPDEIGKKISLGGQGRRGGRGRKRSNPIAFGEVIHRYLSL